MDDFSDDLKQRLLDERFANAYAMLDVGVLVLSCDTYLDVLEPFFVLKERYWKDCPYPTYVATETKKLSHNITLCHDYPIAKWTRRIRESLMDIPTKYVLVMDSDMFIRSKVDQARIEECVANFGDNTACYSFELEYAPTLPSNKKDFRKKPNKSPYLNSCQPSLWDREKLIARLSQDLNPWQWEKLVVDSPYDHYVNSGSLIMDYGYYRNGKKQWFGVRKGKWVKDDVVPLFAKEGIQVDFSKRGFY